MMGDLQWPLTIIGIGVLLIIVEWQLAKKKKDGVSVTDKQRMRGILGVAVVLAVLAWVMIQMA